MIITNSIRTDIDTFYAKINKWILLTSRYSKKPELESIIKMARLKPLEMIRNPNLNHHKIKLINCWVDEYGGSLKLKNIARGKRWKIFADDLSLDVLSLSTDLYAGLPIHKIFQISKTLFILRWFDNCINDYLYYISFVGIDNYLRTFAFDINEWKSCSSLRLGLDNLETITKNIDCVELQTFQHNQYEGWLIPIPLPTSFQLQIIGMPIYTVINK